MKKFLVLIVLSLLLVGCGKVEKFYLEDELYNEGVITEIDVDKLHTLEEEKKNFAVFVYLPGCTSCAEFRTVLDEFVLDNKIEFYTISITKAKGTSIDDAIEYAPSLILYKEGKVVSYLDSTSDKDKPALTNVDSFKKWLETYIYLTK
ncbi:MAG: hypothetical protein IJ475_03665 [Bacilli bacterium]|nr:hypothetical protein [Bacilli bacterium]